MKRKIVGLMLILTGSGMWWAMAHSARFSLKKWDAKFENILRHSLTGMGLTNADLISSVHEVKKDKWGEWVTHHVTLEKFDKNKIQDLKNSLEQSGADVQQIWENNSPALLVKRGNRIYQKINFAHP